MNDPFKTQWIVRMKINIFDEILFEYAYAYALIISNRIMLYFKQFR